MKKPGYRRILPLLTCILLAPAFISQAGAFCFSNNSLSVTKFTVKQLTNNQHQDFLNHAECVKDGYKDAGNMGGKRTATDITCGIKHKTRGAFGDLFRDIAGKGRFSQTVQPGETKCCSWKNRDCNPSGKKEAKIAFFMRQLSFDAGKVDGFFGHHKYSDHLVEIGATDHMFC